MTKLLVKHEAKPSALLASKPQAECFISRKAQARQCFNYFKEIPEKCFDSLGFKSPLGWDFSAFKSFKLK